MIHFLQEVNAFVYIILNNLNSIKKHKEKLNENA